jgi:hypothetical protein
VRYVFYGGSLHGQERIGSHAGARYYLHPVDEVGSGSSFIFNNYPLREDHKITVERYRRRLAWDEKHEKIDHVQWHFEGHE